MTDLIFQMHRIPEGWFIYAMGECVKPQRYAGDLHENTGEGFWCELQHRTGGKLTRATGDGLEDAVYNCIAKVLDRG